MKTKLAVLFASLAFAGAASATPHDYVCETIETKFTEADTMAAECFECAVASAYFVENPFDSETTFETCNAYGGLVGWILPWEVYEPYEEVDITLADCLVAMDRSERLHAIYDANCL